MSMDATFGHCEQTRGAARRGRLIGWLIALDTAYRQRAALRAMGTRQLDDIGIGEADRNRELARAVWDAPIMMLR